MRLNFRHGLCVLAALAASVMYSSAPGTPPVRAQSAGAPGGFIERSDSATTRAPFSAAQLQTFLPSRGAFTFPSPYNTEAVRLTNASDCSGLTDCVLPTGYSYWRNINQHAGSNILYAFITLYRSLGGPGPSLFSYNKATGETRNVGPLFDGASNWSSDTGEGWYFSAISPTTLFVNDASKLYRYDILAHTFQAIFDVRSQFGSDKMIWQIHSSDTEQVHSFTLKDANYNDLGCGAYSEVTQQFSYFPREGEYDECQIDGSGRYLTIKENVDGLNGEDMRTIDLQTSQEKVLYDQDGAPGHSDVGFGYVIGQDNWNTLPGATRLWFLDRPFTDASQGKLVYREGTWQNGSTHISHTNAVNLAPTTQMACGSTQLVTPQATNRDGELYCYRLDGSSNVLVVAPSMSNVNGSGGADYYSRLPKANVDADGQYMMWTSNMAGSGRLDAFIVHVPSQMLLGGGGGGDTQAPTVALTAPASGATVSGSVTVSANATDNVGVAGVQFRLDGVNLGAEDQTSPYSISWSTGGAADGQHVLTAVAHDAAGNQAVASGVTVSVNNTPLQASGIGATNLSSSQATINWTTNLASDSQVDYGTTTAYGSSTALAGAMVTSHSQSLSGLAANTTYHFRVKSKTAQGQSGAWGDYTFHTATGGDTQPPTVSLTGPAPGATVSGTVSISANASDNIGVAGVRFRIDGSNFGTRRSELALCGQLGDHRDGGRSARPDGRGARRGREPGHRLVRDRHRAQRVRQPAGVGHRGHESVVQHRHHQLDDQSRFRLPGRLRNQHRLRQLDDAQFGHGDHPLAVAERVGRQHDVPLPSEVEDRSGSERRVGRLHVQNRGRVPGFRPRQSAVGRFW